MRRIKNILFTAYLAALPIMSISCGEKHVIANDNAKSTIDSPKNPTTSSGPDTPNVPKNQNEIEHKESPHENLENTVKYSISKEENHHLKCDSYPNPYSIGDYDKTWRDDSEKILSPNGQGNSISTPFNSYLDSYVGTAYEVSGIGDAKFKFFFDNNSNVSEENQRKLIDTFINETNWGAGLARLRSVIFINGQIIKSGGKSSGEAKVISSSIFVSLPRSTNGIDELQLTLYLLQHEYGHFETLLMYNEQKMRDALIRERMPLSEMLHIPQITDLNANKNNWKHYFDKFAEKMKLFDKDKNSFTFPSGLSESNFYLNPIKLTTDYDTLEDFAKANNYIFSTSEYLTRASLPLSFFDFFKGNNKINGMNYFDSFLLDDLNRFSIYDHPLINEENEYTKDAKDLHSFFNKYVYGFNNPNKSKRLLVGPSMDHGFEILIRGYSKAKFDFIKVGKNASHSGIVGATNGSNVSANLAGSDEYIKLKRVPLHFFQKDAMFGKKIFDDTETQFGYYAALSEDFALGQADVYKDSHLKVYRDTNNDGILELNIDQEVTNEFWNETNAPIGKGVSLIKENPM